MGHRHRAFLRVAPVLLATACSGGDGSADARDRLNRPLATITAERLREHVETLAAEGNDGRLPSSAGHASARDYLVRSLAAAGVEPAGGAPGDYLHRYPASVDAPYSALYREGVNVVARRRGSDPLLAEEHVVLMAHYDHLGQLLGNDFNGAYDDAAGVAVLLELARAFEETGYRSKRSILFLFTDEEEFGLTGARGWVERPSVPLESVAFAVSADPVGRPNLPGYMWTGIFGLERSPTLEEKVRALAPELSREDVVVGSREVINVFASDQDAFLEVGIPGAWFVNPGFSFYHQPGDTPETIDYGVMLEATRVLAQLVTIVADDPVRHAFDPPAEIPLASVTDYRKVFERYLTLDVPFTDLERRIVEVGLAGLDGIEARGFVDREADQPLFLVALGAVFGFSVLHPGEIPPPFPSGETARLPDPP